MRKNRIIIFSIVVLVAMISFFTGKNFNDLFAGRSKDIEVPNIEIDSSLKVQDAFSNNQSLTDIITLEADASELNEKIKNQLGRSPKILISSFHMTNDWNLLVSKSAVETSKQWGASVIITNAEGSWNKQIDDIQNGISQGVDGIIVAGGIADALQEVIRKASDQGIKVVTVDIPSPYILTNVTSDNYSLGSMLVNKMILDMGGEGNIVVLHPPGWHTKAIRKSMLDLILKEWPKVHILEEYAIDEEDTISSTRECMENAVKKYPDAGAIDAVFTTYGLAGMGASLYIEKIGKDIPVYTVDADRVVLADIMKSNGAIKAVMAQNTVELGTLSSMALAKGLLGESSDIKKELFCRTSLVTSDNADQMGKYLYGVDWNK